MQHTFCGGCIYGEKGKRESAKEILKALVPACELAVAIAYPQSDVVEPAQREQAAGRLGREFERTNALDAAADKASPAEGRSPGHSEAGRLISEALSRYFGLVLLNSALMKHEAFIAEREWRVVRLAFALSQELKFRTTKEGLVPYVPISIAEGSDSKRIPPGLIRRIVVGPLGSASRDKKARAVTFVKMLLENNHVEVAGSRGENGVVVEGSDLPC